MWQDLRYSLRTLASHPSFSGLAVLVLALGIGINSAIFSVINAVLFRPPVARAANELRYVYPANALEPGSIRYGDYLYVRGSNDVFVDLAATSTTVAKFGSGGDVDLVNGEAVSANYFDLLGVAPAIGRAFRPKEDEGPNTTPVAIISYDLWAHRFHADPSILGTPLNLARPSVPATDQWATYTVVGVMKPEFTGVSSPFAPTQFWVPLLQRAFDFRWGDPNQPPRSLDTVEVDFAIGRLKPTVGDDRARVVIATLGNQLKGSAHHKYFTNWGLVTVDARRVRLPFDPAGEIVPSRLAGGLIMVSGLVLLIAVANLTGMLMARGIARRSEIAVRLTLGASRWRLTRQLLTESLLLSIVGGALGLALARVLIVIFVDHTPTQFGASRAVPFVLDVPLDLRVLLFTTALGIGTGVLVGLAPARQARKTDLLSALAGSGAATSGRVRARLRHWIVIPQVCCSMALLLAAGVLVRPLLNAELIDPGYQPEKLVFVDFDLAMNVARRLTKS